MVDINKIFNSIERLFDRISEYIENCRIEKIRHTAQYPVCIGFNGNVFVHSTIQQYFHHFSKFWELWELEYAGFIGVNDCVIYKFRVYKPKRNTSNIKALNEFAFDVAEITLLQYMRDYGYYAVTVDNLVAAKIYANIVEIVYAVTPAGVDMVRDINAPKFD